MRTDRNPSCFKAPPQFRRSARIPLGSTRDWAAEVPGWAVMTVAERKTAISAALWEMSMDDLLKLARP